MSLVVAELTRPGRTGMGRIRLPWISSRQSYCMPPDFGPFAQVPSPKIWIGRAQLRDDFVSFAAIVPIRIIASHSKRICCVRSVQLKRLEIGKAADAHAVHDHRVSNSTSIARFHKSSLICSCRTWFVPKSHPRIETPWSCAGQGLDTGRQTPPTLDAPRLAREPKRFAPVRQKQFVLDSFRSHPKPSPCCQI